MDTAAQNIHADSGVPPSGMPNIIPWLVTAECGLDQPWRHPKQIN